MLSPRATHFLYAMVGALAVYVCSQWSALTNSYVVADDTRQQIYWMQKWSDPELFQNDLLTDYAMNYVSWGVHAIYALAAPLMDPLNFGKVLAGVLYLVTAGFLFGLALRFRDALTPIFAVCVFCFFGDFMERIAGGIPQSFGYPLLTAYLFFLSGNYLVGAGAVLLLASVFNPYVFMLCLVTHGLYILYNYAGTIASWLFESRPFSRGIQKPCKRSKGPCASTESKSVASDPRESPSEQISPINLIGSILLAAVGCVLMSLKYIFFKTSVFGELVTKADMAGNLEYSDVGRYEIFPIPSVFYEFIRPWIFNLPFREWGPLAGWSFVILGMIAIVYACTRKRWVSDVSGFRVFGYLFVASFLLYFVASAVIFRLFLPSRYLELSLTVFYCIGTAVCLREAFANLVPQKIVFPVMTSLLLVLAAARLYHVGIYDYSQYARLYEFLQSTPKTSLMAGHPELMDNVPIFARRKAFVTYELSHTWYTTYWHQIKTRTYDFFNAYYSDEPEAIRRFCRDNAIEYLLVRDVDFVKERWESGEGYFQPFGHYIQALAKSKRGFALPDRKEFPPVYEGDGIRVIKMGN
jgi:hypothetical protein